MTIEKVLATLLMIGSDLPAFRALFDQVKALFSDADQTQLQAAYDTAMEEARKAHEAAQALGD